MKELLYKVRTEYLFHSHVKIKIPSDCKNKIFDELFKIMEEIDQKYNSYSEFSYFNLINKNTGNTINVDKTTIELLEITNKYSVFFDGVYDITVMPFIRLWGFYRKNRDTVPSFQEIAETKKKVNYRNLEIDSGNLTVKSGRDQEIITGSFIKSFAVDKAFLKLLELGIDNVVINAGGSSIRGLNNNTKKEWIISVSDPDNPDMDLFDLKMTNMSYSMSAQGSSFVEINNNKYSHIINPVTGQPSENKAVGIISSESLTGDILSTGLFNCSPEKFLKLIKILKKEIYVEGFLMDKNRKLYYSEGFCKHMLKSEV